MVSPGRVVTNAHVVAGVSQPVVEVPGGGAHARTCGLLRHPARPRRPGCRRPARRRRWPLTPDLPGGSPAAFAGYRHGGPFKSNPATVQDIATVLAPDIYGQNPAPEDIYRLAGDVQPGNSGGPLLTMDGQVAGVIFAKATSDAEMGFAITMDRPVPAAIAGCRSQRARFLRAMRIQK